MSYLHEKLKANQKPSATWGYRGSQGNQDSVESTCFAILALRRQPGSELAPAIQALLGLQNSDRSFPGFTGDERVGCWTTALAVLSLMATRHGSKALGRG